MENEVYYFDLIDEYFDRAFTEEEEEFLSNVLVQKIKNGETLSGSECTIADELFYFDSGSYLDFDNGYVDVEIILKIDDKFYKLIQTTNDFTSYFKEDQVAELVERKEVKVVKWTPI